MNQFVMQIQAFLGLLLLFLMSPVLGQGSMQFYNNDLCVHVHPSLINPSSDSLSPKQCFTQTSIKGFPDPSMAIVPTLQAMNARNAMLKPYVQG